MGEEEKREEGAEELPAAPGGPPFGPAFFLTHLRAFARERCPTPEEGLPAVSLHLAGGEVLDLCHVIGLAPAFVALAVRDEREAGRMRTEFLPYALVVRVTLRTARAGEPHVGFDVEREPSLLLAAPPATPEEALRSAAMAGPGDQGGHGH